MDRETRKYWETQRRQMLKRDRRQRGYLGQGGLITKVLIGLMVVAFLVEWLLPGVLALVTSRPGGVVVFWVVSLLSPGSFIGLIFAGFFVWIIGSQLESMTRPWQYLLLFFGSGIVGALATSAVGLGPVGGTYASFGLAGAYVTAMATRRVGGMAQWAIFLLVINVVLSGFHVGTLAGMFAAFLSGLLIARALRV